MASSGKLIEEHPACNKSEPSSLSFKIARADSWSLSTRNGYSGPLILARVHPAITKTPHTDDFRIRGLTLPARLINEQLHNPRTSGDAETRRAGDVSPLLLSSVHRAITKSLHDQKVVLGHRFFVIDNEVHRTLHCSVNLLGYSPAVS